MRIARLATVSTVGVLIVRTVMWPWRTRRRVSCVHAPTSWTRLDGTTMRVMARGKPPAEPSFLMLWSTNSSSFGLVPRRAIESVFYHHPRATLRVFSNTLPPDFFAMLNAAGYAARVQPYNLTQILEGTPAAPWLARVSEWQSGPYFFSHVTDALRLALLYREGGVYLDSDVLLVRPLRLAGVPSTLSSPPLERGASSTLHNSIGIEAFEGSWFPRPVLNGAILVFDAGSPFLWNAMHELATSYDPRLWGWNGPELLTRVYFQCAFEGDSAVQIEPPEAFYPIYWGDVNVYAGGEQLERHALVWTTIQRHAYTAHLWNQKTASLSAHPRSLLHRLLHQWVVLPSWSAV